MPSTYRERLPALVLAGVTAVAVGVVALPTLAQAVSPDLVISEVYGGGGNSGAPFRNDFIELQNRGAAPVDVSGFSVQYASAGGTTYQVTRLTGTVAPGARYLVQQSAGANTAATALPDPDATGTIAMSATAGKVALVITQTALTCGADCDSNPSVRDFVGYGTANDSETAPTAALSNTTSASRTAGDTDRNADDFTVGAPNPQNSGSTGPSPSPSPTATPTPTPLGPPEPSTTIPLIQGAQQRSPQLGATVTDVLGVVTAVNANGFWFQTQVPDADAATSEGLYVFLGRTAAKPAVGDLVAVDGKVSEFRPGGETGDNLSTSQITGTATGIRVVSSGNTLPAATVLGAEGRTPPTQVIEDDSAGNLEASNTFDPATDGIDFYESLEGMRVVVNDPVAVGPTNDFDELPVLADLGAGAGVRTARGGIVIRPDDFNPERIQLDDALGFDPPTVNVNATLSDATGVVDYSFGNFKVLLTASPTVLSNDLQRESTRAQERRELAVGTFNVENLDPADPQDKFDRLARTIVDKLAAPDILAVEEIQDNNGPVNDAVVDGSLTWERLISAITVAGGPTYDFREIDPVDDQDGGQPGGNIRVGFLFRTDRVDFVDRPGGTSTTPVAVVKERGRAALTVSPGRIDPTNPAFDNSRKPLAGEFRFDGKPVIVIANHFNSKGGDDPLFGRIQPPVRSSEVQRNQQAAVVRDFVRDIYEVRSDANVVVAGDLNDFEFSDAVATVASAPLLDLPATLPQPERYTYVFEGNSQVLDHILISPGLVREGFDYDVVHVNSEFADQVSDHDPQVVRLSPRR